MRRSPVLALVLAALVEPASAADLPEVVARGELRALCVLDRQRPEFLALRADQPSGFDWEVLEGFARLHQLRLSLVPVAGWDDLVPALVGGRGDLVAGRFTVTPTRAEKIAFTAEVFPTRNVVFTRAPHRVVSHLDQLLEEKVGTIKGTSMAEAIARAGVPEKNVDDGLPPGGFGEALRSGRVSAAIWGIESAIALQREDPAIQLGMFLGPPGSLAYGVRKGDTALLVALDEYIHNLRRTASWNRLVVKYFGDAAPEILKKARQN